MTADEQFESDRTGFRKELRAWIDFDPKREELIISKQLLSKSTLRQTLGGTYLPGKRTLSAIRLLMSTVQSPADAKSAIAV